MAVTALEIKTCSPFAQGIAFGDVGPYEQLDGTVHFAVDPDHPSNAGITDLQLAPRDAHGLVRCWADVRILKPAALQHGNHRLLLDIVNRGNPTVLTNFNSAVGRMEPGNGFLMRQGYTVVWCGWQDDVPATAGLIRIQVPEAIDAGGKPLAGKIAVTFQPDTHMHVQLLSDRMHRPHPRRFLASSGRLRVWKAAASCPMLAIFIWRRGLYLGRSTRWFTPPSARRRSAWDC